MGTSEGCHTCQGTNEEAHVGCRQGTHEGQEGVPEVGCDELLEVGRDKDGGDSLGGRRQGGSRATRPL